MNGVVLEYLGFIVEVSLFVIAGWFIWISIALAYFFLFLGFVMAHIVGRQIAINATKKYKEDQHNGYNV